jgi:hypothetical protein
MSIAPFPPRPASPESESRRARLVVVIATVGIAATLLAYAISPGVRHVVGHAAHSVKHAVSHVLDHHHSSHVRPNRPTPTPRKHRRPRRAPAKQHAQLNRGRRTAPY